MKKIISILVIAVAFTMTSNAQNDMKNDTMKSAVKTISLEQTKGEFTQKSLTINEGSYIFKIANNNVGTDVGFVLVPKGKDISKPENHIQTAYVTQVVKNGKIESSKTTKLSKGEYVYFCPLNKTPTYNLIVE